MDRARLTKLLAMTTSDNDGEALNAMRMANSMVKAEGKTWEDVLAQQQQQVTVTVMRQRQQPGAAYRQEESWVPPHLKDKLTIDMIFRTIYATPMSDEFREFMDSVHRHWTTHGAVTSGQYEALRKCYHRARNAQ